MLCAGVALLGNPLQAGTSWSVQHEEHTGAVNLLLQAHQSQSEPKPAGRWCPKQLLGSGARRRRGASRRALGATMPHRSSERCSAAGGMWMRWASEIHYREHVASMGCGFTLLVDKRFTG